MDTSFALCDLLTVNQWVAGSSPAGGANIYAAFKDEGQPRVAPFGNSLGNYRSSLLLPAAISGAPIMPAPATAGAVGAAICTPALPRA